MSETLAGIPYHAPDEARLRRGLKQVSRGKVDLTDTAAMLERFRALERDLADLRDALQICELRIANKDPQHAFYEAERQRLQPLEDRFLEVRGQIYSHLLYAEDLSAIARMTGPLFLYRRQNDELFAEQAEVPRTPELPEVLAATAPRTGSEREALRSSGPAHPREVLLDGLISARADYASELGFNNYSEVAWLLQERYDYGLADAENLRKQVLNYLVPVVHVYRRYWSQAPQTLRFDNSETTHYHQSPLFHSSQTCDALTEHYASLYPALDRKRLHLELTRDHSQATVLTIHRFGGDRSVLIRGNLARDHRSIHQFWQALAEAQLIQQLADSSWILENRRPTAAVQEAVRQSAALLMTEHPELTALWTEDEAASLQRQMLWNLLFELIGMMMLDDFEDRLYSHPHYSITERRDLWNHVARQYWPGPIHRQDYAFFPWTYEGSLNTMLTQDVGTWLDRALAILSAIQCLDLEQTKAGQGHAALKTFAADSGRLPFRSLQELSELPSLFHPDSLKRLAYQLAYQLGL